MIHATEGDADELELPTLFEGDPAARFASRSGCLFVRAEDAELGRRTLRAAEGVLPSVAAALGVPPEPIHIEVTRSGTDLCQGLAGLGRILLSVREPEPELCFFLANQMAVVLMQGTRWRLLPPIVFEGVTELVGERLQPAAGPARRLDHAAYLGSALHGELRLGLSPGDPDLAPLLTLAPVRGGLFPQVRAALALDSRSLLRWPDLPTRFALTGLGYLLARRIGVSRLGALCAQGERRGAGVLGADDLLREARLSTQREGDWRLAIRGLVGERELEAAARLTGAGPW